MSMSRLMEQALELWIAKKIAPIRPVKEFSITDIEEAFRYMSTGTHTGKIVITTNLADNRDLVKVCTGYRLLSA